MARMIYEETDAHLTHDIIICVQVCVQVCVCVFYLQETS